MEHQILIPLDGSALAEAILPHAVAFARATGSALTLLSVILQTLVYDPIYVPLGLPDPEQVELLARRSDYLATVATRLNEEGLQVRTKVLAGDPATHIVSLARQDPSIHLIAMASHGRSGIPHVLFGSVTAKVLQEAPTPLLLFRPHQHTIQEIGSVSYRTILVPLDGSNSAEQALSQAVLLAAAFEAPLVLVSVVHAAEEFTTGRQGGMPAWAGAHLETETERRTGYLEHKARPLRAQGLTVQTEVVCGPPAEGILQSSTHCHPDLIIMATRGRSGLQHLLLGSVAMKVLQEARIPVLLVPAKARSLPSSVNQGSTVRWPLGQLNA